MAFAYAKMADLSSPFLQGCELVKQGHNPCGGHKLNHQHIKRYADPAVPPRIGAGVLKKCQNGGQQRCAQQKRQQQAFEQIQGIGRLGGFVETEALFNDKGGIHAERQR